MVLLPTTSNGVPLENSTWSFDTPCSQWMERQVERWTQSRFAQSIDNCLTNPWSAVESIRQHGDIITNVGYLIFTAGMLIPGIPETVTNGAFLVVNAIGLLYIDFMVSFTWKTAQDCHFSLLAGSWKTVGLTALRTINAVSDTLLTLAGIAAATVILIGKSEVATLIYTITRPWGVTFLFIAIGLDIWNYVAYDKIHTCVTHLSSADNASDQMRHILNCWKNAKWCGGLVGTQEERDLAARVRATMDKYTWKTLGTCLEEVDLRTLSDEKVKQGFSAVMQNINVQRTTERNTIVLTVINYGALFVGKALPNTVWQGLAYLATSVLNTVNQCYKKKQQHHSREDLKEAFGVEAPEELT